MHGEDLIFFWTMIAMVVIGLAMAALTEYVFVGASTSVAFGAMAFGLWRMNRVPPLGEDGTFVGAGVPRPPTTDRPGLEVGLPDPPE